MIIHSLTLYCNDLDETLRFYTTLLSFKVIREYRPVPDVKLAMMERDGMRIELLERVGAPKVSFPECTTTLGFTSDCIEEDFARIKASGVIFKTELRAIGPSTRVFEIYDPSGFPLYFIQENPWYP